MQRKEYLKNVFFDTKNKCERGYYGSLPIGDSRMFRYHEEFSFERRFETTQVDVVNDDVLKVALNKEGNVLVLNLASDFHPGGGVWKGSMAQEEELFRRTNYFMYLTKRFYPIPSTNVIVTRDVTILKDENYNDLEQFKTVSFVAAAAIRNPELNKKGNYCPEDYNTMLRTIENIFQAAYILGYDTLILGALGCGAFHNPPKMVAKIFSTVMRKYDGCFSTIIFSVLSRNDENFNIFNSVIKNGRNHSTTI